MEGVTRTKKIAVLLAFLLLSPSLLFGQEGLIQVFDEGTVNWHDMTIAVVGIGQPDPNLPPGRYRLSAVVSARQDAARKLLGIIKKINLTSETTVGEAMELSDILRARVENSLAEFRIADRPRRMPDSSVQLDIEYSLTGNFLDVVLPVSGAKYAEFLSRLSAGQNLPSKSPQPPYTGLIVDCRGLAGVSHQEIAFALAPKMLNEQNQEIYGPGWVDRETAVHTGLVLYAKNEAEAVLRVGERPLIVKPLQISGDSGCDVIIAHVDAEKILSDENNLGFLHECRVVFLID